MSEICEACGEPEAPVRPHVAEDRDAHLCDPCNRVEIESFPEIAERYNELLKTGTL